LKEVIVMGLLATDLIYERLKLSQGDPRRLTIQPIPNPSEESLSYGIPIHLGKEFLIQNPASAELNYQSIFSPQFLLYPGQLILASPLEFLSLPVDLYILSLDTEAGFYLLDTQ
jgi:hypothetical protein